MSEPYDSGFDLFKREPELSLATVWWRAGDLPPDIRHEFVAGYQTAREQHDEFVREQNEKAV